MMCVLLQELFVGLKIELYCVDFVRMEIKFDLIA